MIDYWLSIILVTLGNDMFYIDCDIYVQYKCNRIKFVVNINQQIIHLLRVRGAARCRWGTIVASQSEGCGVKSRRCPGRHWTFPLSVPITELSKAMVCGALSMGHCT